MRNFHVFFKRACAQQQKDVLDIYLLATAFSLFFFKFYSVCLFIRRPLPVAAAEGKNVEENKKKKPERNYFSSYCCCCLRARRSCTKRPRRDLRVFHFGSERGNVKAKQKKKREQFFFLLLNEVSECQVNTR